MHARHGGRRPARLTIGVDVGGTFVDAVAVDGGVVIAVGKAPTTPADPPAGVFAALSSVAADLGLATADLLAATDEIVHGTTIGLNTLLTRGGGQVGLITTRGHEDAILIGRVHQKIAGLSPDQTRDVASLTKPDPLVPRWHIRGIDERIDRAGREVVRLDEAGLADAGRALVQEGCEAIAVSFLWSFRNPAHEVRAAEVLRQVIPEIPVSISSEIAPVLGEYERTAATVVNAYLLRAQASYIRALEAGLLDRGFAGGLSMLQSGGGAVPARAVERRPVNTLRSGPLGGAIAAVQLGHELGVADLLATDVGGTSFDVGMISGGRPHFNDTMVAAQLHLAIPAVDVQSIGAGGGSVAWLDPDGGLHVGPRSAGAEPGPACYGLGGLEPTVTDADLLLGRLNPIAVLGGRITLDRAAAERAVGRLADALAIDLTRAAAGIVRVADASMADLIRKMTIERGHDPRSLPLVAFGGAGPLHVGAFGPDVGVRTIVIPRAASVFSAVGLALADHVRTQVRSGPLSAPFDAASVAALFEDMRESATRDLAADGQRGPIAIRREADLRYRRQTHQVVVEIDGEQLDAAALHRLVARFEGEYERIFGPGTAYRAAGIEATAFRLIATGQRAGRPAAQRRPAPPREQRPAAPVRRSVPATSRAVYFSSWVDATPVHVGDDLQPGDWLAGPAVVDWPTTTLVLHPGQRAVVDSHANVLVDSHANVVVELGA